MTSSINEWNTEVVQKRLNAEWDYSAIQQHGTAIYLSWLVVGIYIISGIIFFLASSKQKGSRAATAEFEIEDRPIYIGR